MATTTPDAAYCLSEEKLMLLRELVHDGADVSRALEEGFRALLSTAAGLQEAGHLSSDSWDWAEGLEAEARSAAETMREEAGDIRRAVSVLSLRPGEEAFAEALREQAAFSDARAADADELVAATRRLQEEELGRLAAEEHRLVDPRMPGFLGYVAGHTDAALEEGYVPTAEEMAVAALVEAEAARVAERMARIAGRLRRGAGAGDEALVAALQRQAANADAARAVVEAFAASVRRFLAAGRNKFGAGGLATPRRSPSDCPKQPRSSAPRRAGGAVLPSSAEALVPERATGVPGTRRRPGSPRRPAKAASGPLGPVPGAGAGGVPTRGWTVFQIPTTPGVLSAVGSSTDDPDRARAAASESVVLVGHPRQCWSRRLLAAVAPVEDAVREQMAGKLARSGQGMQKLASMARRQGYRPDGLIS